MRGSKVNSGNARQDTHVCECSDRGCEAHRGVARCGKLGEVRVKHENAPDDQGLLLCHECDGNAFATNAAM